MTPTVFDPLTKISKDIMESSKLMSRDDVRYAVDLYYQIQEFRKAAKNQKRATAEAAEPSNFLEWAGASMMMIEQTIKRALDKYSSADPTGQWAKSICGIGPVIAAGLLAHIDIEQCPTVGHLWRFGGLDPTVKWEKKHKRPWNAGLRVLYWKVGESFVKVSGKDQDIYGKLYLKRKVYEIGRNDRGDLANQAKEKLENFKIDKKTEAYAWYSQGKLPPAHIHARAKRWATKIFLSHYHYVAYWNHFKKAPPAPFAIEHLGHVDFIPVPNFKPMGTS